MQGRNDKQSYNSKISVIDFNQSDSLPQKLSKKGRNLRAITTLNQRPSIEARSPETAVSLPPPSSLPNKFVSLPPFFTP